MTVDEYEDFFLGLEIMNQKNEQDLIKIAREGLKEDIREGLEFEEFATLQALFLEAAAVEEIWRWKILGRKTSQTKKRKNNLLDRKMNSWDKPQPEEEEESEDEESDDDWSYEGDTRVEVEYDDMGFSTPGSVSAASGSISGSNSTGVGSVSGNVADSSPSAVGSSRISNSVAFSGAGKCSAISVVSNL
ncbi:hypothetical protein Bca52824_058013 [Brassica carinata]|uniref:Uncharacterized protein n=1 Tax=Brassica carinata TaxID=52824 RepID=A0A8X7QTH5_BRACI|nr:hypothetical protein Bca52824_058013 [Brassica carinata]